MFGLTFDKLAIIAVIAIFLLGPERLPMYAAKLAALVRSVRSLSDSASARIGQELGPEFADVDWKKLDPRQYDPRRIIREALLDEGTPPVSISPTASPRTAQQPSAHSIQRLVALGRAATVPSGANAEPAGAAKATPELFVDVPPDRTAAPPVLLAPKPPEMNVPSTREAQSLASPALNG